MERNGESITAAHARHSVSTGIAYAVQVPGLVPWYEEDAARTEAHYSARAWQRAGPYARALEVAHFRLRRAVALHSQDAVAAEAERQAKRHP